jgi:hypothetical protein
MLIWITEMNALHIIISKVFGGYTAPMKLYYYLGWNSEIFNRSVLYLEGSLAPDPIPGLSNCEITGSEAY